MAHSRLAVSTETNLSFLGFKLTIKHFLNFTAVLFQKILQFSVENFTAQSTQCGHVEHGQLTTTRLLGRLSPPSS